MKYFSDQEIIQRIRQGHDREVIDSLYTTVLPNVKKHVCHHGGSLDDAYDVFQDAMMVFYKLVVTDKYDGSKYKVHGFIFTICKNLWVNLVKKRASMMNREKNVEMEKFEENILSNIIQDERKSALNQLFETLGMKCKEILILFFYQKLSFKEISEKIGDMSEEAVKVKSHRCKKQLTDKIKSNQSLMEQLRN